jgi:hypothetical protein
VNNKHCVILYPVLSKMAITTVAHNDTCSKHPTDGCHLRPAVITLSAAADQHCTEVLTAVCYTVSTVRVADVSEDRVIFIFNLESVNALQYMKFFHTHPLSSSHRSCPYNICRRHRYETPNHCLAAVFANKVPVQ